LKTAESDKDFLSGGVEKLIGELEDLRGSSLVLWLAELQAHICVLGKTSSVAGLDTLVSQLIKLPWRDRDKEVVEAHKGFLVNLVSANTCYLRLAILRLLENFKPAAEMPSTDSRIFRDTHETLERILSVAPVAAREELLTQAASKFPFIKLPAYKQICYVSALLEMTVYLENSTGAVLAIIMERIIKLDAHLSRETVDEYLTAVEEGLEIEESEQNMVTALDLMIRAIIAFIDENTKTDDIYDEVKARPIVANLFSVFETHMLPAYKIVHTPFIYFHLVSQSPAVLNKFLLSLWKTFSNPNSPSILRQSAVSYISSLLSRLSICSPALILHYLEKLSHWAHGYLRARDANVDFMYSDLAAHGPFYACCQAIFYLFAFRHSCLMSVPSRAKVVTSLSWHSLVTSSLNPLRLCLPAVSTNFSVTSSHYQLAYCEAVLARNRRINLPVVGSLSGSCSTSKPLLLDAFFPFDPYLLEGSRELFQDKYLAFSSLRGKEEAGEEQEQEEGDGQEPSRKGRLDSCRSSESCRSRKDSVGCLADLLIQDLPG